MDDAAPADGGFIVTFAGGERVRARGLVLAVGVRDLLPDLPGFRDLWGRGVFHCPYCHGWEVAGRPLGVFGSGERALHLLTLVRGLTDDLVLFTDGPADLPEEDRARIEASGIAVREEPVERLVGSDHLQAVVLHGGEAVERAGLFMGPAQELRSDLPRRLGCSITPDGRVDAEAGGRTTVPGVYVAGDAAPGPQSVPIAAASGMLAGAMLNHDLATRDFEGRCASGGRVRPSRIL